MNENQWKINENWMKFPRKFNENQAHFDNKFLYYPLLNFERKSMKSDNKFRENQWKLNEILAQNDPFLNEISENIDPNLTPFYGQIQRKSAIFDQNGPHFE